MPPMRATRPRYIPVRRPSLVLTSMGAGRVEQMFRLVVEYQYREMAGEKRVTKDFDTRDDTIRAGELLVGFICGDDCFATFYCQEITPCPVS